MKDLVTLLLCGDMMTGRGMISFAFPGDPQLYEMYMYSAKPMHTR